MLQPKKEKNTMENYKIKEDSDMVKLTRIWVKALICLLVTLILTTGIYHMYRNYKIGESIKKGNDPIVSRLAFSCGIYERLVYLSGNKHILDQQSLLKTKK